MGRFVVVDRYVEDDRLVEGNDYLTVPADLPPTAALFPSVSAGRGIGRGTRYGDAVTKVEDGSKIVVPEGYGLLLSEDGRLTAYIDQPGSYIWYASGVGPSSYIVGDEFKVSPVRHSWEYFHTDSRPQSEQIATFVRTRELPSNRFGTQSTIYWDDAYLGAQVGATAYGSYSLTIIDPIKFAMQFVPAAFIQGGSVFDFTDWANSTANQMFYEVVGSLASAMSRYVQDPGHRNRISGIQQDSVGFAASLSEVVEDNYSWKRDRGVVISNVVIMGIEYDSQTKALLREVQRFDAVQNRRPQPSASPSAGPGPIAELASAYQNPGGPDKGEGVDPRSTISGLSGNLVEKLANLAQARDAGLITSAEYDAARAAALGLG